MTFLWTWLYIVLTGQPLPNPVELLSEPFSSVTLSLYPPSFLTFSNGDISETKRANGYWIFEITPPSTQIIHSKSVDGITKESIKIIVSDCYNNAKR